MSWQRFQDLQFLSNTQEGAEACVVLFHGYGADANDLASLSRVFKLKKPTDWFFPQGFLEVPIGPMMTGRAWFHMRASDFENAALGKVSDAGINPEDEKLLKKITPWLNHLGKLYKQVFIGGFSQGSILTSHSFYRLDFSPSGLLLLSGFLVAPSAFPTLPPPLKVPFFQSHGSRDEVLSMDGGRRLFNHLTNLGLNGTWYDFPGGHEIPMDVIAESQIFVNSLLNSGE